VRSGPVSRILYSGERESFIWATSYPAARATYPETHNGNGRFRASLFGLAPQGVYLAIHTHAGCGALLPHHFTLTWPKPGGLFSVALSVVSPRLDVIQPAARGCSDFPPRPKRNAAILRPTPHDAQTAGLQGEFRVCGWHHQLKVIYKISTVNDEKY